LADSVNDSARVARVVLARSSNHYPLGNCDWPKLETNLGYLTRFGTVSRSLLAAEFLVRVTDDARTPPEELVNPASAASAEAPLERGSANQPDPAFPQSPGIIHEATGTSLSPALGVPRSFNELIPS